MNKKAHNTAELALAIEVLGRAVALKRSFTHPYALERVGPAWVMRDGARGRVGEYRREEWLAFGPRGAVAAEEIDRLARKHTRGRYAICAVRSVNEDGEGMRAAYKALGYRLGATEPIMVHRLGRIAKGQTPFAIERVRDDSMAARLAKTAGRRQLLAEHLADDSRIRQYVALDGKQVVGWVQSIATDGCDAARWVSNLQVKTKYRRRGIGGALMTRMLRDDRAAGASCSVLTASHTGALLYLRLGYALIGELLLYTPKKSPRITAVRFEARRGSS